MPYTIYLCGAINKSTDQEVHGWREVVKKHGGLDYNYLDPTSRDYRGVELDGNNAEEIVKQDLQDIQQSDIILYYYTKPSVGSAMEVFYAASVLKKPVLVINASGDNNLSPWLVYHSSKVVKTINEALLHIEILEGVLL